MIPLTSPMMLALSFFRVKLTVKDAVYVTVDGVDEQAVTTRTITAAVDPSAGRKLKIGFGGNVSDGDIVLLTDCLLSIDDMYAQGSRKKQSFVLYQGWQYRIVDVADWRPQVGMQAYLARRHVTQDLV